jgi:hypothetical protein
LPMFSTKIKKITTLTPKGSGMGKVVKERTTKGPDFVFQTFQ